MAQIISTIISDGILPVEPGEILKFIGEQNGTFISTEGENWDFKESWPFSYSDSYFHGICRLICAFANTAGGMIIFGVHDKTRKGGYSKVNPNVDRLTQAFRQLTGQDAHLDFRRYESDLYGAFDILLVNPLTRDDMPLGFLEKSSGYPPHVKWVREGNEVVPGGPSHLASLYCRSKNDFQGEELTLEGQLPPSPATIRRFVGRMTTIDRIFGWLKKSDQPRTFLYGKGGSGKSTIAFEVARTLKGAGGGFRLEDGAELEKVIFISAKQVELNTETQQQVNFRNNDFEDERTLYEAILTEGGGALDSFEGVPMAELKKEILSYFEANSTFLVIDDIDTLTTKGIDAGFDFLFGALCRARKRSKIIYTLRNVPTHSLANSIEVPGLELGSEFEQFVQLCSEQFKVDEPEADFRNGRLVNLSERRPLVVESIIALRRHTDSYNRAATLFEQQGGDDVRSYVFRREWEAISAASRGRDLLAVLSLYGKPIIYDDLVDLMHFDAASIHQAITAVQEMFLKVDRQGDSSTYQLSPLTQSFIESAASKLDIYAMIKARVQKYKSNIYAEDPALSRLSGRVMRLLTESLRSNSIIAAQEAWHLLMDDSHDHAITQDPRYMALCGFAAVRQIPSRLVEARTYFENSFAMRYSPEIRFIREWFYIERTSDMGDQYTSLILKLVKSSRGYSDSVRAEFISKRASFLYNLARQNILLEPERSVERLKEALSMHSEAYRVMARNSDPATAQCGIYTRNTAFYLFQQLARARRLDDVIAALNDVSSASGAALDPIEEAIMMALSSFMQVNAPKSERQRWAGKLVNLGKILNVNRLWLDGRVAVRVKGLLDHTASQLRA